MVVVITRYALTFLNARGADSYAQIVAPVNAAGLMQLLASMAGPGA